MPWLYLFRNREWVVDLICVGVDKWVPEWWQGAKTKNSICGILHVEQNVLSYVVSQVKFLDSARIG